MRISLKWYDLWIGLYWDREKHILYFCPLPCVVVAIGDGMKSKSKNMTSSKLIATYRYLKYIIRHKYRVAKQCFRQGEYLRGITHDWTKFLPDEFFPFRDYFYLETSATSESAFTKAWLKHQHRNDHHWQYWVLLEDDQPKPVRLGMSDPAMRELAADWISMGGSATAVSQWVGEHEHILREYMSSDTWNRVKELLAQVQTPR